MVALGRVSGEASDITMNTQNPPNCSLLLRSSQAVSLRYHQGVGVLILFLGWSIRCCFKFISLEPLKGGKSPQRIRAHCHRLHRCSNEGSLQPQPTQVQRAALEAAPIHSSPQNTDKDCLSKGLLEESPRRKSCVPNTHRPQWVPLQCERLADLMAGELQTSCPLHSHYFGVAEKEEENGLTFIPPKVSVGHSLPDPDIHLSGSKASLDEDGGSQTAEEQAGDVGVVLRDTDWTTVFITKVKC